MLHSALPFSVLVVAAATLVAGAIAVAIAGRKPAPVKVAAIRRSPRR
jgi:hypothetical protein